MRRVYRDNGYQETKAPQILDKPVGRPATGTGTANVFVTEAAHDYALKPMNCQTHILIFKRGIKRLPRPAAALRRVRPVPPQQATGGLRHNARAQPQTATSLHRTRSGTRCWRSPAPAEVLG